MTLSLAVLVSGSGSNLQAILDACAAGAIDAKVVVVFSNVADAFALERAKKLGVPTRHLSHKNYTSRAEYDRAVVAILREQSVDLVVLAGYMRIVTSELLNAYEGRVINIHPALLPAFPGTHAQKQAFEYGVKWTGCTVHFVDVGTDTGAIIAQTVVPVDPEDTEQSLSAKILIEEHKLLPQVLQWFAENRVTLHGRKTHIILQPAARS